MAASHASQPIQGTANNRYVSRRERSGGRPVVVADPNHLESRMLAFFADAVEETPLQGAKALLNLLRAESGWRVVKSEGREDPFERRKILEAVRAACRHAKRDDVAIPGRVLPAVIERLRASDRRIRKSVTATDVDKAVTKALDELESDAAQTEAVAGVLNAWRSRHDRKRSRGGRIDRVRDRPPPDRVLYDRGVKGTMQSFQVRVQSDSDKPKVAAAIERELRDSSKWAQRQAVRTRER